MSYRSLVEQIISIDSNMSLIRKIASNTCNYCTTRCKAGTRRKNVSVSRSFSSPSNKDTPSLKGSGNWKKNGTPEIIIGSTILSLLLVDSLIQKYNESASSSISKEEVLRELELAIQKDHQRDNQNSISNTTNLVHPLLEDTGKEKVTLYKCKIMKIPKYFDGTRSLKNVKVNDVVQVVQEFVGPDSNYHLCKIEKKINDTNDRRKHKQIDNNFDKKKTIIQSLETTYEYGWFPTTCLKKL